MQFDVILGILLTVLGGGTFSRAELSKKFEISPRTVSRYLMVIAGAGVPIESVPGKNGGIRVPDSYKLDRIFFSNEELKRLSACLSNTQPGFDDGMNLLLIDKINNLSRSKDDEKYLLKSDTLVIDTGTWTNPQHYRNKMQTINKAIAGELTLSLIYIDRHEYRTERLFDPYSLVFKESIWYVYGFCHLRGDFRLFKLSRIQRMDITTRQFERMESNVYEKLREVFDESESVELEIEFHSTVLAEMEEWLGMDAITDLGPVYHAKASLYGGKMLINKLLSFGSSVRVLSPPYLRQEIADECKRIANNY